MSEHEPSGRVVAFETVLSLAVEEAEGSSSRWSRGFGRGDVEKRIRRRHDADVSTRTVDRALKDAAALGWVEDRRQGWDAGERAEQRASD